MPPSVYAFLDASTASRAPMRCAPRRRDAFGPANVGPNPTFGENARKVEVHLIGFAGDLYGQTLSVDFIEKIRDTKPFGSPQELVAQIQTDIGNAKRILEKGKTCQELLTEKWS
jgi:FAD synthase